MPDMWKRHCPYANEEQPARRQAWRKGWLYRKNHGSVDPAKEIKLKMFEQGLLTFWLRGYSAANSHLRDEVDV